MEPVDKEMIKGVLKGDKVWIRKFEQKFRHKLLNFVLQKIGKYEDAEEIVQDILISAIYCLPSFLGKSSLWTWMCGIAKHEIADFYRKRKIKEVLFSRFPGLERLASKALSPELALEEKEIKEKIVGCFLSLTEGYRDVLRLKYVEGHSVRQIGQQLKKTSKAIEMRLRRARVAFVQNWNEKAVGPENLFTLSQRNLSFFKQYLWIIGSSLPDPESFKA
jgi:RNA polymerase sigma-70 factor (ECF subfamily)